MNEKQLQELLYSIDEDIRSNLETAGYFEEEIKKAIDKEDSSIMGTAQKYKEIHQHSIQLLKINERVGELRSIKLDILEKTK